MFEFLTQSNEEDAIGILKNDHNKVKDLFDNFEKADNLRAKKKIVADVIKELKIHASIEEEIFYAAVRPQIDKKIMNEADEEHHVAKLLIAELEVMDGTEDHYDAKFKVLSENIRHHIREEENDMLPKARALDMDMDALGKHMLIRKELLLKRGVATFAEEKMVAASKGKGDSPAKNAHIFKAKNPVKKSAKVLKMPKAAKSTARKIVKSAKKNTIKLVKASSKAGKNATARMAKMNKISALKHKTVRSKR